MRIIELRNYLLEEGATGDFIRFFEENFLFSQREEGMSVLGQFAVVGEPDRFVWIRAFESMETRRRGLGGFYGGPAWKAHGPTANGMMLEFHNVHLLRPLAPIADLTGGLSLEDRAAEPAGALPPHTGLVAVDFHRSRPGGLDRRVETSSGACGRRSSSRGPRSSATLSRSWRPTTIRGCRSIRRPTSSWSSRPIAIASTMPP